uniref:Amino acid permease N-terminal domain-containing protein n=1 Tax=Sinocyclocheilus anshuiensis TaxID=1608454 RepID=A0A671P6G5_9TELE
MENPVFERSKDDPPQYEETSFCGNGFNNGERRAVRPSVVSAFGHNTLDGVPNVDFYRNAASISGHRAVMTFSTGAARCFPEGESHLKLCVFIYLENISMYIHLSSCILYKYIQYINKIFFLNIYMRLYLYIHNKYTQYTYI